MQEYPLNKSFHEDSITLVLKPKTLQKKKNVMVQFVLPEQNILEWDDL